MKIIKTDEEINALLNAAYQAEETGKSKFPGMSYEQGIAAAIAWITGDSNDHPLAD